MKFYLMLFFCLTALVSVAAPVDSLRTENIDGKLFIIHQVDPQETLFALARRYNISVEEIKQNNPIIAEGLRIGDVLRIPFTPTTSEKDIRMHTVQAGETLYAISRVYDVAVSALRSLNKLQSDALTIGQELEIPENDVGDNQPVVVRPYLPDTVEYQWHVVRQGETLFGLSRMYNREVAELTGWNNIINNSISIGDSLIVNYKPGKPLNSERPVQPVVDKPMADDKPNVDDRTVAKDQPVSEIPDSGPNVQTASTEPGPTREIVTNDANYEELVETGLAELIENSGDTQKYLALHRTASIGTIIRVRNEMNDREVFVRVLGRLPDTGNNEKLLMKISQAAYDRLGAIDKRFRVRISYFPE